MEVVLERIARDTCEAFRLGVVDETLQCIPFLPDVRTGLPRSFAMLNVRIDMLMQRTACFDCEAVRLFIDHTIPAQRGIGDMLRQDSLGRRLVGRAS
ncbi:MAG: hypothetical protein AAF432_11565 [Planctomycetota bacterium]